MLSGHSEFYFVYSSGSLRFVIQVIFCIFAFFKSAEAVEYTDCTSAEG